MPFSDLQGIRTYAKRNGDDWILNGSKVSGAAGDKKLNSVWPFLLRFSEISPPPMQVFISNGWLADLVLVVAVTNRDAKSAAHGISLFLVEKGAKGFNKGRKLEKMGLKAQVPEPCRGCLRWVWEWREHPSPCFCSLLQGHSGAVF